MLAVKLLLLTLLYSAEFNSLDVMFIKVLKRINAIGVRVKSVSSRLKSVQCKHN